MKLSEAKKKLEDMKAVLGKYRVKDENAYANQGKISHLQTKIDQIGDELLNIEEVIKKAEESATAQKEENVGTLQQKIKDEQTQLKKWITQVESENLMSKITPHKEALAELKKVEGRFDKSMEDIEKFRSFEQTLGTEVIEIPEVEQFRAKFEKRQKIWKNWDDFQNLKNKWYNGNFKEQPAEDIVKQVNLYGKTNMEIRMKMAKTDVDEVLDELTKDVKVVDGHKNLILALGSKAMQARHWGKVYAVLEQAPPANLDVGISLTDLIDNYKAMDKLEEIEDISGSAQGEM